MKLDLPFLTSYREDPYAWVFVLPGSHPSVSITKPIEAMSGYEARSGKLETPIENLSQVPYGSWKIAPRLVKKRGWVFVLTVREPKTGAQKKFDLFFVSHGDDKKMNIRKKMTDTMKKLENTLKKPMLG